MIFNFCKNSSNFQFFSNLSFSFQSSFFLIRFRKKRVNIDALASCKTRPISWSRRHWSANGSWYSTREPRTVKTVLIIITKIRWFIIMWDTWLYLVIDRQRHQVWKKEEKRRKKKTKEEKKKNNYQLWLHDKERSTIYYSDKKSVLKPVETIFFFFSFIRCVTLADRGYLNGNCRFGSFIDRFYAEVNR